MPLSLLTVLGKLALDSVLLSVFRPASVCIRGRWPSYSSDRRPASFAILPTPSPLPSLTLLSPAESTPVRDKRPRHVPERPGGPAALHRNRLWSNGAPGAFPVDSRLPRKRWPGAWCSYSTSQVSGGPSRRRTRQRRLSPSKGLIDALRRAGPAGESVLPLDCARKLDLSYVNPQVPLRAMLRHRVRASKGRHLPKKEGPGPDPSAPGARPASVQSIAAGPDPNAPRERPVSIQCIVTTHILGKPCTVEQLAYLSNRGYRKDDVELWADIVLAKSDVSTWRSDVPMPIILFTLRRRVYSISRDALRHILLHVSTRLQTGGHGCDDTSKMCLFVRLIRHARVVWPQSLVAVADLIVRHLSIGPRPRSLRPGEAHPVRRAKRMTSWYNALLKLLSLPCSHHPFRSSSYQEEAQNVLLRQMAALRLVVDRRGYRAIARVKLMLSKTVQEQEWALLKSEGWPPWMEAKTGIDEQKGPEHGISRAAAVLRHAQMAGYTPRTWERTAKIFTGWDTDHTPTVQTRKIVLNTSPLRVPELMDFGALAAPRREFSSGVAEQRAPVWAARIEATRTVEEAWAMFLECEAELGRIPSSIYFVVLRKLKSYEDQVNASTSPSDAHLSRLFAWRDALALPGDRRDVFPSSNPSSRRVHTLVPLPSLEEFIDRMVLEECRPDARCLAFIISTAPSVDMGQRYIRTFQILADENLLCLLDEGAGRATERRQVPVLVFSAWIELLCRYPKQRLEKCFDDGLPLVAVVHALNLVRERRPRYYPPWLSLIRALALRKDAVTGLNPRAPFSRAAITAQERIRKLIKEMDDLGMDLQEEVFQLFCVATLNSAIEGIAAGRDRGGADPSVSPSTLRNQNRIHRSTPDRLRSMFHRAFGTGWAFRKTPGRDVGEDRPHAPPLSLPRINPPGIAVLHAYVRALGVRRDYEGIYSLAQWMARCRAELDQQIFESVGGLNMLRKTVAAMRVFLERSWEQTGSWEGKKAGAGARASDELILLVREEVEQGLGVAWAEDVEVERYVDGLQLGWAN